MLKSTIAKLKKIQSKQYVDLMTIQKRYVPHKKGDIRQFGDGRQKVCLFVATQKNTGIRFFTSEVSFGHRG